MKRSPQDSEILYLFLGLSLLFLYSKLKDTLTGEFRSKSIDTNGVIRTSMMEIVLMEDVSSWETISSLGSII